MARYQGLIKKMMSPDLPEIYKKLPLVELAGDERVLIENHHCVMQYTSNCICVKVSFGGIRIKGKRLRIVKMTSDQLVICGGIDCVELHRACAVKRV